MPAPTCDIGDGHLRGKSAKSPGLISKRSSLGLRHVTKMNVWSIVLASAVATAAAWMLSSLSHASTHIPQQVLGFVICAASGTFAGLLCQRLKASEKDPAKGDARETQYRALANAMTQLAWIARADGSTYWYNDRWYAFSGTTLEAMQGTGWTKLLHPDHYHRVVEFTQKAWRQGEPWELTFPIKSLSGEWRWFLTRAVPLKDAAGRTIRWFGTSTDIHDQRLIEEALDAANSRYEQNLRKFEAVFDSLSEGLVFADVRGTVIQMNKEALKLYGFLGREEPLERVDQFAESFVLETLDGQPLEPEAWPMARVVRGERFRDYEVLVAQKRSGKRWIGSFSGTPVRDADGIPQMAVLLVRDVTDKKNSEAQLLKAKEEADRANALKSAFLANMSHEIRTPLGAIMGFAELLSDDSLGREERRNFLGIIIRNGEQLGHVINDILDLSKVEAGHLHLEYRTVSPEHLAQDVHASLSVQARAKGLEFAIEVGASALRFLTTDPFRLRQILCNVVGNAIKFTETGKVSLRVYGYERGNRAICAFEVEDSGIGLDPAQKERIFAPFVQADGSVTRKFGGTGLGLSLSRKLARSLGGDITVIPTKGQNGSCFLVTIEDRSHLHPSKDVSSVPEAAPNPTPLHLI